MQNWTMNLIVFFVVAGSASWVLIGSSDDSVIESADSNCQNETHRCGQSRHLSKYVAPTRAL